MARARASANIALVKYWGKRDPALNLPSTGSLSVTLDPLFTETEVALAEADADRVRIDGAFASEPARLRVERFLDLVRSEAGSRQRAVVESTNTFPTSSGLASSASAFAALAVAATRAYGLELTPRQLSVLARRGSGSAARSIFGGFVRMRAGDRADGSDAHAEPFEGARVELAAAIMIARAGPKAVGSTEGMERTRATSPFHDAWCQQVDRDLARVESALRDGDFEKLAETVEGNCLAMHANAMAARPGIVYLGAPTLWAIDRVRALRAAGEPTFFTIDAGPHVVAFAAPASVQRVAEALREHADVERVITAKMGCAAALVEDEA